VRTSSVGGTVRALSIKSSFSDRSVLLQSGATTRRQCGQSRTVHRPAGADHAMALDSLSTTMIEVMARATSSA